MALSIEERRISPIAPTPCRAWQDEEHEEVIGALGETLRNDKTWEFGHAPTPSQMAALPHPSCS